jgi:type IX secretion system PorP/SprF family membrane protein
LIYNPGYAGTSGGACGVAQFRQQWVSFAGAPQSIAVAVNTPLTGLPIGVGLTIMSDKIGPMNTVFVRAAGSWNKKIGPGTLGLGLDIGMLQKKISDTWIVPEPLKNDPRIPGSYASGTFSNPDLNKLSYDIGVGAFYQIPDQFYVGISSTHLPAQTIKGKDAIQFALSRHYYLMAGYTIKATPWLKVTPNVLAKTDGAATTLDANLTLLWSDMIWIGGTYRTSDAAAILVGFQKPFATGNAGKFKIGYSYDFTTSNLNKYSSGSHEIILGVCYTPKPKKQTTYGSDRFLD